MRFYTQQHRFCCGVDLHARTMYLCILDGAGQVVYDKNLAADPDAFLPGNNMDFLVSKPQERKDLVAYFKQSVGE